MGCVVTSAQILASFLCAAVEFRRRRRTYGEAIAHAELYMYATGKAHCAVRLAGHVHAAHWIHGDEFPDGLICPGLP